MSRTPLLIVALLIASIACAGAAPSAVGPVWSGVPSIDKATVANAMASEVRKPGRCFGVSRDAVFLHPKDTGDATATWHISLPKLAEGDRLILSTWIGISDGAKWDDPKVHADGADFAVRIGDKELFRQLIAESKWMQKVCDLGPWAGQDVDVTLITDCGGKGNASYDWAQFGEPQIVLLHGNALDETGAATGTAGVILADYAAATPDAKLTLAPVGKEGGVTIPLVGPGPVYFEFTPDDLAGADHFRVTAAGATMKDLRACLFQPYLSIESFGQESAVAFADQPLRLMAQVKNTGRAALLPAHKGIVTVGDGLSRELPRLEPGQTTTVNWEIQDNRASSSVTAQANWTVDGETLKASKSAEFTRVAKAPVLSLAAPTHAEVVPLPGGEFLLQNPYLRLAFISGPGTFPVLCYARVGGQWRLVATIPNAADISEEPGETHSTGTMTTFDAGRGPSVVVSDMTGTTSNPNRSSKFTLADNSKQVEITTTVQAKAATQLLKLSGPKVLVGDGSTGRKKNMALFPGLEYLQGDEESSSTLDFAPILAKRLVPDPHKVTIPLMAVETEDALVALMWDQNQKWDGTRTMPAAAFASPNFVDGQANHLMQLFLPPVPEYTTENDLKPNKPYLMAAGQTLTLKQSLLIAPGEKVLDAIDHWTATFGGTPPPFKAPRDFNAELALSRYGFMHTVWDAAEQKSRHCVGWTSANAPGVATLLLFDARLSGNADARQRAELIAQNTINQQGKAGLLAPNCCHILNGELPFHYGYLPETYDAMRVAAYGAMGGQSREGAWAFYPAKGNEALGKPGTAELGTCARPAWLIMRYARYTGDAKALDAGLLALRYMDAHFIVPRGAQGWECPVHEPDILASGYAVGAFLEGYRATGDKHWLDQAVYWARTGLPFLYYWDDGKLPGMRYATIPVFGSTFFTHSWLGLPVQWCGLVYAYHIQHLAQYDKSQPWARLAAGMTVSGMYQQFGDESPELKGCYPDSWRLTTNTRNAPFINPEDIILNRLVMEGHDPDPSTAIVTFGKERFHLTTGASIPEAKATGDTLSCRLSYFPGEASFGFVANVAEPKGLALDGVALKPAEDLQAVPSGFQYDAANAALFFKVTHGKAPSALSISGVRRAFPPTPPERTSWDFTKGLGGWHADHSCDLSLGPDGLLVKATGPDVYFVTDNARFDCAKFTKLIVRARASVGTAIGLYWQTDLHPGVAEDKRAAAPLPTDGQWHDLVLDLSAHPLWHGTITGLRLDWDPDVPVGSLLEIQSVRAQ